MTTPEKHPFDESDEDVKLSEDAKTSKEPQTYQPEPEDQGMVVKPFCECQNCTHWTTSADWCTSPDLDFEGQHPKKIYKEKKVQPLLRSEKYPGKTPKIFTFNPSNLTKVERQTIFRTLVQGEIIPQPVKMFSETYFSEDIQLALEKLNYKYSLPIQAFVWPAIFRQMNVFMIGGHNSGKTLAYLPAVCTFSTKSEQKYAELEKYKGPLVAIICPNSKQCEEVLDLIKKLYKNIQVKPKIAIMTYPIANIQSADILIALPHALLYCLKSRIFNLKRLCHLVLEDASNLLKDEASLFKILNVVDEMLEHRVNNAKVQLIATSEKWSTDLEKLFKSVYITPLVCVGNYLEAALYGASQFEIKFLLSEQKEKYLEGILRNKYHIYKTIVICDNSEMTALNKWLVRNGIATIALSDSSSKEDIEECEIEWAFTKGGQFKVLICTDFVFDSLLCINDAMWLINYSLPSTWTRFTKRFSALSVYYKSPFEPKEERIQCKSFVLVDETCESQMPKILNLLRRLNQELPPNYQKYADGFKSKSEDDKINTGVEICEKLKLFGKCSNSFCEQRHLLSEQLDIAEDLPKSGKIVFKILHIKDVTQFVVQLIEHVDLTGCVQKINDDDLKKPLIYHKYKKKRANDLQVGNFYAYCENTIDGEVFMLCHVRSIPNDTFIEVKLTTGVTLQTLRTKLYLVPPNLQIVDVVLSNLIPPFQDDCFCGRSFYITRISLANMECKSMTLTGDIHLQLDRTLWLDNVVQKFTVEGTDVVKFNLTKHLISLKVVEPVDTQIAALHKLCAKCDIVLPCYVTQAAKKAVRVKEVEPQWAYLDDNVNEVIFSSAVTPDEFYVRLAKFQCLLENLEKDIQSAVKTEILDKAPTVAIGKYYLGLDPSGELYSRVLILEISNDKALCFYVDYGDEAILDIAKLKILPSKFVKKLPFQAIRCRLYGLSPSSGTWSDDATDVLYKYLLEPDSDIFRSLFVLVLDKDKSDAKRAKIVYSVLLKDGYGEKNVLINQLMLDCGFASSFFERIEDFEIPKPEVVEESSDSGEAEGEGGQCDDDIDVEKIIGDEFDLEVFDAEEFFDLLGFSTLTPRITPQVTYENGAQETATPEWAQKPSTCCTPEVFWSQNDKTVKIKIKLISVEDYKVTVVNKRIFGFSTTLEGKNYELKFTVHKPVTLAKHQALGQEVQVTLNKIEPSDWAQLSGTQKRMRNIHYEIPDNEKEKPKRKFLQLDITDEESDENDGEKPMVHEISDLDSEFDEEAYSSSSDRDFF